MDIIHSLIDSVVTNESLNNFFLNLFIVWQFCLRKDRKRSGREKGVSGHPECNRAMCPARLSLFLIAVL